MTKILARLARPNVTALMAVFNIDLKRVRTIVSLLNDTDLTFAVDSKADIKLVGFPETLPEADYCGSELQDGIEDEYFDPNPEEDTSHVSIIGLAILSNGTVTVKAYEPNNEDYESEPIDLASIVA